MKTLKKDVKSLESEALSQETIFNIQSTQSWLNGKLNDFLKQFDITINQFHVLQILKEFEPDPLSVSRIKKRMPDKMPDVSRIIERLRSKKLLKRTVSKTDRREVNIHLSGTGLRLIDRLEKKHKQLDTIAQGLSESEMIFLIELLTKMRKGSE